MARRKAPGAKTRQINYVNKWIKDTKLRVTLLLDRKVDSDLIEKLNSVPNKSEYLRRLVQEDIDRQSLQS